MNTVRTSQITSAEVTATAAPATQPMQVTVRVGNATGFRLESTAGWICHDLASTAGGIDVSCQAPASGLTASALVFEFSVVDPRHAAQGTLELRAAGSTASRSFTVSP